MTIKFLHTLCCFIIAISVMSCDKNDTGKNKTSVTTTAGDSVNKTKEVKTVQSIGGTYTFGSNPEKEAVGSIMVYPLNSSSALFYLDITRGAPSYNSGQLFGEMNVKDSIGIYDSKADSNDLNCILTFHFSPEQLEITTNLEYKDCGFGNGVNADNKYKLTGKALPEYFINGEGDTIQFKGLTVEKYKHRND